MTNTFKIWRGGDGSVLLNFSGGVSVELSDADAAALSAALVVTPQPKRGGRWSAEDDDVLRKLHAEKIRLQEIGARLGRTRQAVAMRAVTLGITNNRPSVSPRMKDRKRVRAA